MRVMAISGSPRRSGNSEILLNRAIEGAFSAGAEAEKIFLDELRFKPCQECGGCDKTGVCVIRDDMDAVYAKLDIADAFIFASPIFFTSVSAQAKMMIDRLQCRWVAKYILNKKRPENKRRGIFLSVAGSFRREHFDNAKSTVKAMFATLDVEYAGELFRGGIEKMNDIVRDDGALREAYALGKGLVNR